MPGVARFRVASFRQRGNISIAFRRVSIDAPLIPDLNLPEVVSRLPKVTRGMILVTGVTGSGKSTTLAGILNQINVTRREHIVTVEDPIEYLFDDKLSLVNQLEVGLDCPAFGNAMKHILRFDPDIIMIGEMRDRDTIDTALQAVDTGHLVLSTLHTSDAKQTINRILHFFEKDDQPLVLEQLSLNLHTIISQRLLPRSDIEGLIPACEILVNTPIVSKLIAEGRIDDIQQALKNEEADMQSFDMALAKLVKGQKITMEEALKYCSDEATLRRMIRGEVSAGDRSGAYWGKVLGKVTAEG